MQDFRARLQRAKQGDREAIDALLSDHLGGLRAFVRLKCGRVLRQRESCSDLVQTVFRSVLEGLGEADCEDERSFRSWLYTVAYRRIVNRVEFHTAQMRDADREVEWHDERGHAGLLSAYGDLSTPSRHAAVREEVARLEEAMDRLSDEYREVIIEACLLRRSRAEIAEATGRSEVAVRKLLSRARARLALELRRDLDG